MSFYNALQLDPALLKAKIKEAIGSKEKWFYRLAIVIRAFLIVAFSIVFISILTSFFGSENSPMAVALFCILLSIRFVNFEYCIKDSLVTLAISFSLLVVAPYITTLVNPIFAAVIHFLAFFTIIYMTSQRPEFGNGGLYGFAYIFLVGNPVSGDLFIKRVMLTLVGYIICAAILFIKHRDMHKSVRFYEIVKRFSLSNEVCRWHLRMAIGVALVLTVGRIFNVERYMWMGFACSSMLSTYPYSNKVTDRCWQRVLGVVVGSALYFIIYQIIPESLHTLMGPVGGLCLGFCTDYRYKTAINCFGALMIASSIYGVGNAATLRVWDNILGVIFAMCFVFVYHKIIDGKFDTVEAETVN